MSKTMIAVFDDRAAARHAVEALFDSGFSHSEVSLMANNAGGEENIDPYRHPGAAGLVDDDPLAGMRGHTSTKGLVTGGVLGGLAGLLLGLGSLAVPGVGPVVAAGPIATMLVGAAGGAAIGGLVGALIELGVPEGDAHIYSEAVRRGSTIVAVTGPDEKVETVSAIFRRFDPIDVRKRSDSWRTEGWSRFDDNREPLSNDAIVSERARYATVR
jgi:hypothetical protein